MKNIGSLRKEIAKLYNLQLAAKQCIDSRDSSRLLETMTSIEVITEAVRDEIHSQWMEESR